MIKIIWTNYFSRKGEGEGVDIVLCLSKYFLRYNLTHGVLFSFTFSLDKILRLLPVEDVAFSIVCGRAAWLLVPGKKEHKRHKYNFF